MSDSMVGCVVLGFVLCLATIGFFTILNLATDYFFNSRTERKLEALNQLAAYTDDSQERMVYYKEIKRLRKKKAGLK